MRSRISTFIIILIASASLNAQVSAFLKVDVTEGCETLNVTTTSEFLPTVVDSIILDFGDGTIDTIINPAYGQNNTHTYDAVGNFTITLTAYLGVDSGFDTKTVHVYPLPNANFSSKLYGYPGLQDTFYYSNKRYLFVGQYPNDTTHTWAINGELQYSITDSIAYNFKTIGVQNITHTIIVNGCFSTSSQTIETKGEEVKIPNIFSPNGDGINDVFYIQTDGNMIYKFTVLNRNGSRVYTSEEKIISWDGRTYWGEQLHPGNYYFSLESSTGEIQTGVIYLAR